jgi:hypothetical protein
MNDTTFLAQFLAVVLFAACLWHSWNTDGRRSTWQWFIIGYIFAILFINLLVVIQQIAYNAAFPVIGAAPSLLVLFLPSTWYLAYTIAKWFVDENDLRGMTYLMFLLTPALMLPLDAVGVQLSWWFFPTESFDFLNGVPFYIPFAWGVVGASFYFMIGRIRKIRFRGNGQFFAMMIAAPLLAGLVLFFIALVQIIVDTLVALVGTQSLYLLLALLFVALPLALAFNIPRLQISK